MLLEKDSTKVIVFPGEKKGISSAFRDINPQFSKPGSALTSFRINQTKRPCTSFMRNDVPQQEHSLPVRLDYSTA